MLAAPLAGQHCAGRQVARLPLESLRQRNGGLLGGRQVKLFEKANGFGIKLAHRLGLQTIGEHRKQKMPGEVSWRVLPEACPPSRAQSFGVETAQARDLGFDREGLGSLRSDPGSRHGGQDLRPSDFVSAGLAPCSAGIR
jgi:hypothetical protein